MTKHLLRCFITLLCFALQPLARPGQAPQTPEKPGDQQSTVRLKTQLIQVQAVVTDKRGRPVVGLSKEDFDLRENDRSQDISFFAAERLDAESTGPRQPAPTQAAPGAPGEVAQPAASAARRSIVVFVDSFNMSAESLLRSKQALRRFVDEKMTTTDVVAIVASSGSLGLLSEFTADRGILHYAIERLGGWRVVSSTLFTPYLAAQVLGNDPFAMSLAVGIVLKEDHLESMPVDRAFLENYSRDKARGIINEAAYTRQVTLGALKAAVEALFKMPGQRLVALLSNGFTLADESAHFDFGYLQDVISKAARAGVVIYSIHAPGLEGPPLFGAGGAGGVSFDRRTELSNPHAVELQYGTAAQEDEKNVLSALAKGTGGDTFFNTNDLLGSLQKGLDANRVYYTLSYYPNDDANDKKFRNITVKVRNHPEYSVRNQKGYAPAALAKEAQSAHSATPEERLIRAMAEPLATTVIDVEESAEYFEQPNDQAQVRLHTYISGAGFDYHLENERYQFKLEVVTRVYDAQGRSAFSHSETISGNLKPERFEAAKKAGLTLTKRLALKPGLYQIRIGAQEDSTGKIGTASTWIEVPDLKDKRLAMSSILVGADVEGGKPTAALDAANESATIHTIKFFAPQDNIVYAFRLYHPAVDSTGASRLEMEMEIVRGSETVGKTDWSPVAAHQVQRDDLGVLVAGKVPLSDIKPGVYELRLRIRDPQSKQALVRAVQFGIRQVKSDK